MNIYNSKIYNIIDDINSLNGINYFRLVFIDENEEEIIKIINSVRGVIDNKKQQTIFDSKNNTRGHFVKSAS